MDILEGVEKLMEHRVITEIASICETHSNVNKAVLFGSRARGDHRERSDFDIAIYLTGDYCRMLNEIDQINTLLKIDVTIIKPDNGLSELFLENVESEGVTIYEQISK